jgi:hypothetical protein
MRVEDAQQIQPVGFDPVECLKLFVWVHHEARGTLSLIPHKDDFLDPVIFASQQTAGFQRHLLIDVVEHFVPVMFPEGELPLHGH